MLFPSFQPELPAPFTRPGRLIIRTKHKLPFIIVNCRMFAARQQHQIFGTIIGTNMIHVVNNFIGLENSTNNLLHDKSVLPNVTVVRAGVIRFINHNVPIMKKSSSFPSRGKFSPITLMRFAHLGESFFRRVLTFHWVIRKNSCSKFLYIFSGHVLAFWRHFLSPFGISYLDLYYTTPRYGVGGIVA